MSATLHSEEASVAARNAARLHDPEPAAGRPPRVVASLVWGVLVPALVSGAALRWLFPTSAEARGTWAMPIARLGDEHPLGVGLALFVGISAIARYWSPSDPGTARPASAIPDRAALGAVIGLGALAICLRGVLGIYTVESASMLPTLTPEDSLLGSRIGFTFPWRASRAPRRGDIVVFRKPEGVEGPDLLVKRVVGLPGDRVTMHGAIPVINGEKVRTCEAGPYLYPLSEGGGVAGRVLVEFLGDRPHLTLYTPGAGGWGGEYLVKPGEVFVLGDNRANSSDSRAWNRGKGAGLPFGSVVAKVERRLFGYRRDHRVDVEHLLRALELSPYVAGVDTSFVRDGIKSCLEHPPPASSAEAPR